LCFGFVAVAVLTTATTNGARMTALLATLWLGGCAEAPPDTAEPPPADVPDETPIEPSPWSFDDDDTPSDTVDLAGAGRALDAAVVEILELDSRPIVDAYRGLFLDGRSLDCPDLTDDGNGGLYWNDGCSSLEGTYFGGYLSHYVLDGAYQDDLILYGDTLGGVVTVIDAAGRTLDLEGDVSWVEGVSTDGLLEIVASVVSGGFYYSGGDATGWLREGRQAVTVGLTGIRIPIVDGTAVVVEGAVNTTADGQPWSAMFLANTVGNAAAGSACDQEPGGTIELRDPSGRWIDITFHGPNLEDDPGDPTRCDGCGDATVDGEPVGEICADFTPWMTWEALP
jgi:hypothetical protein